MRLIALRKIDDQRTHVRVTTNYFRMVSSFPWIGK